MVICHLLMKHFCDIGPRGLDWEENVGLVLSKTISQQ